MTRHLTNLLLLTGILFVFYNMYQIYDSEEQQEEALAEAQDVIELQTNIEQKESHSTIIQNLKNTDGPIGILDIPKLNENLPIVRGTTEEDLEQGVGHYDGTALPSENNQILLSGHRDTVFRDLGKLKVGDSLIVEMPYGDYEYIIKETEIVDAYDRTVIRDTAPDEILTLSTCYPFDFVGDAPDRYIIYAVPKSKLEKF